MADSTIYLATVIVVLLGRSAASEGLYNISVRDNHNPIAGSEDLGSSESSTLSDDLDNPTCNCSALNTSDTVVDLFEEEADDANSFDHGLISEATYLAVNRYTVFFILPVISVFGIVGNCISLHLLLHLPTTDSVSVYLCWLAITDMVVLICQFVDWLPVLLAEIDKYAANALDSHLFVPNRVCLKLSAINCSSYIILIISFSRVLAVVRPMRMKDSVFVRFPKVITLTTIFAITVFFLLNVWRYEINAYTEPGTNRTLYRVDRSQFAKETQFFNTYGLIGQIIFTVSPPIVVLCCNLTVIFVMFRQSRLRREMTSQEVDTDVAKITWMLVTIASIFVISTLPRCVMGIISKFSKDLKLFGKEHYLVRLIYALGSLFTTLNSGVNFLVYVVFSSRFRDGFVALSTCRRKQQNEQSSTISSKL